MTEVEFSRQLSELSNAAAILNRESDSVNEMIERFEETLRKTNLGLEVWVEEAVESTPWSEEDERGEVTATGTHDAQLGFAKYGDKWQLVLRHVTWRRRGVEWEQLSLGKPSRRLLDASREHRITGLKLFPVLLAEMKRAADDALKAIQEAKKFVNLDSKKSGKSDNSILDMLAQGRT